MNFIHVEEHKHIKQMQNCNLTNKPPKIYKSLCIFLLYGNPAPVTLESFESLDVALQYI
jgi:hypothetical protein